LGSTDLCRSLQCKTNLVFEDKNDFIGLPPGQRLWLTPEFKTDSSFSASVFKGADYNDVIILSLILWQKSKRPPTQMCDLGERKMVNIFFIGCDVIYGW